MSVWPTHHLKSVIEIIQEILEIDIMKSAESSHNTFGG